MKRELLIYSHGCETPSSRHGRGTAYHEDCHLQSKSRRRNSSRTSLDCLEPSSCLPLFHSRPFKRASDPIRCSSGSPPLFNVLTPARPAFTELPDSTFSLGGSKLLAEQRSRAEEKASPIIVSFYFEGIRTAFKECCWGNEEAFAVL